MRGKKLILATTESGCIIPTSHKLNSDGYFRKKTNGVLEMYHRTVWKEHYGDIPEGYEVDHKCRNRACCNVEHLQLLEGSEHTVKTNRERYADRKESAKEYWLETGCTGMHLGEKFGVTFSAACKWIREWKA